MSYLAFNLKSSPVTEATSMKCNAHDVKTEWTTEKYVCKAQNFQQILQINNLLQDTR